jgi:hypothetical protein
MVSSKTNPRLSVVVTTPQNEDISEANIAFIFIPEDGGSIFLRNFNIYINIGPHAVDTQKIVINILTSVTTSNLEGKVCCV